MKDNYLRHYLETVDDLDCYLDNIPDDYLRCYLESWLIYRTSSKKNCFHLNLEQDNIQIILPII